MGDDEARTHARRVAALALDVDRLRRLQLQKRELIQRRDALGKIEAVEASGEKSTRRQETVHVELGGSLFHLPYDEARRFLVRKLEAVGKDIDALETSASRYRREIAAAPPWLAASVRSPDADLALERGWEGAGGGASKGGHDMSRLSAAKDAVPPKY